MRERDAELHVVLPFAEDDFVGERGSLVVIADPAVRRAATAETVDAAVLAIGNRRDGRFQSTWNPEHFRGVPTYREQRADRTA